MFNRACRSTFSRFVPTLQGVLALLAITALASCAEMQPPIDRVQPDVLEKSFFVGKDLLSSHDDPEFWAQSTLVDVGYGAAQNGLFTSTYAQPLSRIKWVIQEKMLVARLTYELVDGADGKGAGPASSDGQVVAAYQILSHFDIQREYNPSTGEETNVIVENTWDRPWYEREYMRVDWSKNLNTDAYELDTLAQLGVYGGITYTPLAYYVNEPDHPDAPVFDLDEGYFDVTTKAFAKPGLVDLRHLGWGIDSFPACWLTPDVFSGTGPGSNCNPVELTIRHSFRRVVDNDYEPAHWDGQRFRAFGAFTTERYGFSRNYGMSDSKWYRFINRYNIWERSHYYKDPKKMTGAVACFTPETTPAGADPNRDLNGDGTADECASVGRGSQCDTFNQKCTLPFRERSTKPVVWYYSEGSTPEYFEPTEWAAHEWDVALRQAVMSARYAECQRTGGGVACAKEFPVYSGQMDDHQDAIALAREVKTCESQKGYKGKDCKKVAKEVAEARGYSAGVLALAQMEPMGVMCHSPVEHNDPKACGEPRLPKGTTAEQCAAAKRGSDLDKTCKKALRARLGDLRYDLLNVIDTPQSPSPWGIMVDSHDPLTGEKVATSSNVWAQITDLWSQSVVDLARYVKGELSTEDVTEGTYVHDWAVASKAAAGGGATGRMSEAQRDHRIAEFLGLSAQELASAKERAASFGPQLKERLEQIDRKVRDIRADAFAPTSTRPKYESRRLRAQGSDVEAELTTKAMQQLGGLMGGESASDLLDRASPLRGGNLAMMLDLDRRRQNALAERGACVLNEAPAPVAIAAFADVLEEKFGAFNPDDPKSVQLERAERMRKWLAFRAHASVMTHEMGHSIGLRHNFVSSSDAFNYRPQYWQLRTNDGAVTRMCTDLVEDGDECVGPRWFDPPTDNEMENMIWLFQQSSTMDYPGEATQNLLGLGAYDFAATRMFYGDSVAVQADNSYQVNQPRGDGAIAKLDQFGGLFGWNYQYGASSSSTIHYSELQRRFRMIQQCAEIDPETFKPAGWDKDLHGPWHPLADSLLVKVDDKYTRCRQQPVDYVQWEALQDVGDKRFAADSQGRARVPYGFATDRWADLGNAAVYRHDNGADTYEIFDFLISQQETMHVFDNYRRNRQGFSVRGVAGRSLGRYNEKLRDGAKGIGLMVNIYKDLALQQGFAFDELWPVVVDQSLQDNVFASSIVFDHFARQLQRPQAGEHFLDDANVLRSTDDYYGTPSEHLLLIPNGATGMFGNVSFGGKPLENALARDRGDYDSEYTLWAGSYYEKAYTSMLMTESVDNFISSSRNDFLDARFRAVSMADVFPEGYRRWLANNLTGDAELKGPRVKAQGGLPASDLAGYPEGGIGWTSWWPESGPELCFPQSGSLSCGTAPNDSIALDPQIGWEQQKFLIAWTLQFIPENEQQDWLNMLGLWEIGADNDPRFEDRIEFHDPSGRVYVAKTFGKEEVFGKEVQRGIAARMLEYANEFLEKAYEVDPGPDLDGDGKPDWWIPVKNLNNRPMVKFDPELSRDLFTGEFTSGRPGCNPNESEGCTCSANRACVELSRYNQLPSFLRQSMRAYGLADPSMRGIY